MSAGVRALAVTEKLRVGELARKGGNIGFPQGQFRRATALLPELFVEQAVQVVENELLPHSGLACYE